MKNRKTVVIAFLLCACLVVGIGYATLNDELNINGTGLLSKTAADAEFEKDVYFSEVVSRENCTAVISASDTSNDTVIITIDDTTSKMAVKGDKATIVLKVANASLDVVNVTVTPNNVPEGYFTISCDKATFSIDAGTEGPDGTVTPSTTQITATVTLNKAVDENLTSQEAFNLTLIANSGTVTP